MPGGNQKPRLRLYGTGERHGRYSGILTRTVVP